MVYCTRCGTLNPDSATNCSNCGAPLFTADEKPYLSRYEHRRYQEGYAYRRGGSGFGLLIGGVIIVLIGLAFLFGYSIGQFFAILWPAIIVIVGLWLIYRGLKRSRSYRQVPPPQ